MQIGILIDWLAEVSQGNILNLQDCQIELFGIADDLESDLWSFDFIPSQEDTNQVNLCIHDPQISHYTHSLSR